MRNSLARAGDDICPRPPLGGSVIAPDNLHSSNGRLKVEFSLRTSVGDYGLTRYCYLDANGLQAPTLRLHQGDELTLALRNDLPAGFVERTCRSPYSRAIRGGLLKRSHDGLVDESAFSRYGPAAHLPSG